MVDHNFFDKAFDIYRKKFNDEKNKVIFLAVSDDNKWLKVGIGFEMTWTRPVQGLDPSLTIFQVNLKKHTDVRFSVDYSSNSSVSPDDVVGFDLCVLATSDHSVFTVGSFGLWGALLAGG